MPTSRWVGFAFVWAAVTLLTLDAARASRQQHAVPAPSLGAVADRAPG